MEKGERPAVMMVALLAVAAGVLVATAATAETLPAQEVYDAAGHHLYSIDERGSVSRYEPDPSNNGVSVTYGTLESLKPEVTDTSPPAVEIGTITPLVLRGNNLLGSTIRANHPGIRFEDPRAQVRTLAVLMYVDPATRPGQVSVELSTPIGVATINVELVETNLAAFDSHGDADSSSGPVPGKPEACPEGMVAVSNSQGGFCIDINKTDSGDWFFAEKACEYELKRLCWADEWEQACHENQTGNLGVIAMPGEWEWTRSSEYVTTPLPTVAQAAEAEWMAIIRGQNSCGSKDRKNPWRGGIVGRCCK